MKEKSPERKYAEVTTYINILSYRATEEEKPEISGRLKKLEKYLQKVREQRHLGRITEDDRIEKLRFKEILGYINDNYDGTAESIKKICRTLDKREDIDEVLKHSKKEIKEEER